MGGGNAARPAASASLDPNPAKPGQTGTNVSCVWTCSVAVGANDAQNCTAVSALSSVSLYAGAPGRARARASVGAPSGPPVAAAC